MNEENRKVIALDLPSRPRLLAELLSEPGRSTEERELAKRWFAGEISNEDFLAESKRLGPSR